MKVLVKSVVILVGLIILAWLPYFLSWYNWHSALGVTFGAMISYGITSWYFGQKPIR